MQHLLLASEAEQALMPFSTMMHDTAASPMVKPETPVRAHRHCSDGVVPHDPGEMLASRKASKQEAAQGGMNFDISLVRLKVAARAKVDVPIHRVASRRCLTAIL